MRIPGKLSYVRRRGEIDPPRSKTENGNLREFCHSKPRNQSHKTSAFQKQKWHSQNYGKIRLVPGKIPVGIKMNE